jgi:hypothetical protein
VGVWCRHLHGGNERHSAPADHCGGNCKVSGAQQPDPGDADQGQQQGGEGRIAATGSARLAAAAEAQPCAEGLLHAYAGLAGSPHRAPVPTPSYVLMTAGQSMSSASTALLLSAEGWANVAALVLTPPYSWGKYNGGFVSPSSCVLGAVRERVECAPCRLHPGC